VDKKYIHLLEFDVVRERLSAFAKSEEAASQIKDAIPSSNKNEISETKKYVSLIAAKLQSGGNEPCAWLPPIKNIISTLTVEGITLSLEEVYAVAIFVEEGSNIIKWLCDDETLNKTLLYGVPDCINIVKEIFAVIGRDGNLRDLDEFKEIKKSISSLDRDIQNIASSYFENERTRGMLQSQMPSFRDGRTVIALKANFKGKVRGIIHEVSATGQTLFLEPDDIVEKNNDITILKQMLSAAIRRVLHSLTLKISFEKENLFTFYKKIIYIDSLRARSYYSNSIHGTFALDAGEIKLKGARHPLLGANAVPIDISVRETSRAIIITGPNTGGKTVALKTIGLFAMMNQAGIAVPALEGTIIPIFDNIYADIGDEQSIDSALSTFSAHIKNVSEIYSKVTEQSLVLLDELGSGTDAEEGAAIAMAAADAFIEKKCMLFITSHHSVLKNYGWKHNFVENASMDFDTKTLLPTYRLVMGVPGASRAIDVAEHNMLPKEIIESARKYLKDGESDVSALIAGLIEKNSNADKEKEIIEKEKQIILEKIKQNDLKELKLKQKEAEIKSGDVNELRALLNESRKRLENLVREIKEGGALEKEKTLSVKKFLNELSFVVENEEIKLQNEIDEIKKRENTDTAAIDKNYEVTNEAISIGSTVLVGKYKRLGAVRRPGKKGFWIVDVGSVSLPFKDVDILPVRKK
jgi:DNA mismatch repair protein MutS2